MSDFLGAASRNASSRMESMGVPSGPGDPMTGQGKRPMGEVHYRAAGASTGAGPAPLPGPTGEVGMGGGIGPGANGNCGSCANFDGMMSCSQVAGNIDPSATCDIYTPQGGGQMAPPAAPPGPVGGEPDADD